MGMIGRCLNNFGHIVCRFHQSELIEISFGCSVLFLAHWVVINQSHVHGCVIALVRPCLLKE